MAATVRYLVGDVERATAFYRDMLGFEVVEQMGAAFARVGRDDLLPGTRSVREEGRAATSCARHRDEPRRVDVRA